MTQTEIKQSDMQSTLYVRHNSLSRTFSSLSSYE